MLVICGARYISSVLHQTEAFSQQTLFYNMAGTDLLRLIMVQLTLGTAVEYLIVFFRLMIELASTGKMTRPRFEYEGTYARRAVIIVIILLFGAFVPLLFVFGAMYMFITFIVERWLIMYFYRKSPSAGMLKYCLSLYS